MFKKNSFAGIGLCLLVMSICSFAEDGMLLATYATSGDAGNVNMTGNIRRIDMKDGIVVNTTGNLGYGRFARFSPDGTQFAFINGSTVTIANLDGGVVRTFTAAGNGYLSWTNGGIWINANGNLYKYNVTTGAEIASARKTQFTCCENTYVSQNEITAGATCPNGPYGEQPYIYSMGRNTSLMVAKRNPSNPHPGCSVCPNPSGTLLTNNLNEYPVMHRTMRIIDTLGVEKQYIILKNITGLDSNWFWNTQCWSGTAANWLVLPIGRTNTLDNPCLNVCMEPWIYNIQTNECYKLASASTNQFWNPYDYYSGKYPGSTTTLQVSPSSLNIVGVVNGANPLIQSINAFSANGSLTGLTVTKKRTWLTVTPSATSGASITITNAVSLTGLTAGTYKDTVTVATTNSGSRTYYVTLTVQATATLTSVSLTPLQATLIAGTTYQFLAEPYDQAGNFISGATTTFSVSGGGTIDATGKFTVGTTQGGPYYIYTASQIGSKTVRDTSIIVISKIESFHKKINCGNNTYDVAGWERDDACLVGGGGTDQDNAGTVTTTNVAGAAPATLYKSMRHQSPHTYTINGLKPGSYTVRFHWAEPTASTRRYMNYTINGTNVLRDFDIATRAGSINKALVLDREVALQDTSMQIVCTGSGSSDVFECGIEIILHERISITLIAPQGGEKLAVGQTFIVRWSEDSLQVPSVDVILSVDNGVSWGLISPTTHIVRSSNPTSWDHWSWTIPDTFRITGTQAKRSTVSTQCLMGISKYNGNYVSYTDSVFTISASTITVRPEVGFKNQIKQGVTANHSAQGLLIHAASLSAHVVEVISPDGSIVTSYTGNGTSTYTLPTERLSAGAYILRMKADGKIFKAMVIVEKK